MDFCIKSHYGCGNYPTLDDTICKGVITDGKYMTQDIIHKNNKTNLEWEIMHTENVILWSSTARSHTKSTPATNITDT